MGNLLRVLTYLHRFIKFIGVVNRFRKPAFLCTPIIDLPRDLPKWRLLFWSFLRLLSGFSPGKADVSRTVNHVHAAAI